MEKIGDIRGLIYRRERYLVMNQSWHRRLSGFALIELVAVIIVLGIISVVVIGRFPDSNAFETRGFADQTLASLQYARKLAVATGRTVCVTAASGANALMMTMASSRGSSSACSVAVTNPSIKWRTYSGVSYGAPFDVKFFGDGAASGTVMSFSVAGTQTYAMVVETTGYVHCNPVTSCD